MLLTKPRGVLHADVQGQILTRSRLLSAMGHKLILHNGTETSALRAKADEAAHFFEGPLRAKSGRCGLRALPIYCTSLMPGGCHAELTSTTSAPNVRLAYMR